MRTIKLRFNSLLIEKVCIREKVSFCLVVLYRIAGAPSTQLIVCLIVSLEIFNTIFSSPYRRFDIFKTVFRCTFDA